VEEELREVLRDHYIKVVRAQVQIQVVGVGVIMVAVAQLVQEAQAHHLQLT